MIVLHHCHQSRSMRVLWLLNEMGLEYDLVLHPFDKSLRRPEFLSRSPAGRVPALELNGELLFESGAIIQVLCARYPEAGLGRGPEELDWPEWLVWLHFAETLSQHVAALTQQHIVLYEDEMRSPILMKLEAARAGKCFDAIEARLSTPIENRDHLLTSGFSAADIAVGQAVYMARHYVKTENWPELTHWYERISSRPAFQASLPPEGADLLYSKEFYEVPGDGRD